ncbi:MAG: helix-turn-helix domain-containing protein [Alphaproteobacteria bacterium]
MTSVQKKLKEKMENQNLTSYALARKAGVPASSIKNIIYGKSNRPRYELVRALSEQLDCDIKELFSDNDPRMQQSYETESINDKDWSPKLHLESMQAVYATCQEMSIVLTERKAKEYVKKVYIYSKEDGLVDKKFADWVVKEDKKRA